jgi:hypothetical protein
MARIHMESDEAELPNLADLLKSKKSTARKPTQRIGNTPFGDISQPTFSPKASNKDAAESGEHGVLQKNKSEPRRQRPLKRVENNSVLLQPLKVSSDVSKLDGKLKKRGPSSTSQKIEPTLVADEGEVSEGCKEKGARPRDQAVPEEEENTLDEIEFWSRPRPLISPPQTRPPPETPRAARKKARSFRLAPPLKESLGELQSFHPQTSNSAAPLSRPTSSDNDHAALLT